MTAPYAARRTMYFAALLFARRKVAGKIVED
jgi:hypothetical protein